MPRGARQLYGQGTSVLSCRVPDGTRRLADYLATAAGLSSSRWLRALVDQAVIDAGFDPERPNPERWARRPEPEPEPEPDVDAELADLFGDVRPVSGPL